MKVNDNRHDLTDLFQSYSRFKVERTSRHSFLIADRGKLSSQIANLTRAIADRGPLPPLLDKISELSARHAQINTELRTLSVPLQPLSLLTNDQLAGASQNLKTLSIAPSESVRTILQSFIAEIRVERKEKEVVGSITYYCPLPFDFAPMAVVLPIGSVLMRTSRLSAFVLKTIRFQKLEPGIDFLHPVCATIIL